LWGKVKFEVVGKGVGLIGLNNVGSGHCILSPFLFSNPFAV
jgi:hypothetical protein